MNVLLTSVLVLSLWSNPWPEFTTEDRKLMVQALRCDNARNTPDLSLIQSLIRVEHVLGLPQGMILSAACHESGFQPKARGDHAFCRRGRAKAVGILQQWPWWEQTYGIDRTDPVMAAIAWGVHVRRQIPKVRDQCRFRDPEKVWVAAWVTAIRSPKPGGRCGEKPRHFKRFKKWQKQRQQDMDVISDESC
jgi:hypothetical protein